MEEPRWQRRIRRAALVIGLALMLVAYLAYAAAPRTSVCPPCPGQNMTCTGVCFVSVSAGFAIAVAGVGTVLLLTGAGWLIARLAYSRMHPEPLS